MNRLFCWGVLAVACMGLAACSAKKEDPLTVAPGSILSSASSSFVVDAPSRSEACRQYPGLNAYKCSPAVLRQAAKKGDVNAQYRLGYMYYYGLAVPVNRQRAQFWIQRSAAHGFGPAVRARGLMRRPPTQRHIKKRAVANQYAHYPQDDTHLTGEVKPLEAKEHSKPVLPNLQ